MSEGLAPLPARRARRPGFPAESAGKPSEMNPNTGKAYPIKHEGWYRLPRTCELWVGTVGTIGGPLLDELVVKSHATLKCDAAAQTAIPRWMPKNAQIACLAPRRNAAAPTWTNNPVLSFGTTPEKQKKRASNTCRSFGSPTDCNNVSPRLEETDKKMEATWSWLCLRQPKEVG